MRINHGGLSAAEPEWPIGHDDPTSEVFYVFDDDIEALSDFDEIDEDEIRL